MSPRKQLPRIRRWLLALLLMQQGSAHALMAGAWPDSPAARVDANRAASPWAGVGSISAAGQTFSGALVARDYVLTAAHVAAGLVPGHATFNLNAGGDLSEQVAISNVFVHPGYRGVDRNHVANDIALIKLAQPVPDGVPIYGLYRNRLPPGATLTMVGYGASGQGDLGVSRRADPAVKRVGKNVADNLGPGGNGSNAQAVYYFDFDGPDAAKNRMGGLTLGNRTETSLADGDSGSPAFVRDRSGHWLLAGVNTFRFGPAATFGNGGGGQNVATYAEWIDGILLAPATPIPEPDVAMLLPLGALFLAEKFRRRKK
ncbi:MAG: S1 family peptidase [Rhodocyclaceae bacterium]|nr:MAG: S1 family peptidase [Rhodocyclaceae bacterium]